MDSENIEEKESPTDDLFALKKKVTLPDIDYVLKLDGVCLIISTGSCVDTCNSGKNPDVNAEYLQHDDQLNCRSPSISRIRESLVPLLYRHKIREWTISPQKCEPKHAAEDKLFSVKKKGVSEFFQTEQHKDFDEIKRRLEECARKVKEISQEKSLVKRELRETLEELGRVNFENDRKAMMKKREDMFKKMFKAPVFYELPQAREESPSAASVEAEAPIEVDAVLVEEIPQNNALPGSSVQESSSSAGVSFTYVPPSTAVKRIDNYYKLLLIMISRNMLSSSDIMKLQEWARHLFMVKPSSDIYEVLLELDRKGVISVSNMTRLREFFEECQKFDVVHLIDCFLQGDYAYLQRSFSSIKNNYPSNNYTRTTVPVVVPVATAAVAVAFPVPRPNRSPMLEHFGGDAANAGSSQGVEGTQSTAVSCVPITINDEHLRSQLSTTRHRDQRDGGNNGQKLSKFQCSDSATKDHNPSPQDSDDEDDVDEENWLCTHYKRRCHVKFACCDKYWPCHRCHNNESNCGQKKLKSIDTKFVKCVKCKTEQEFSENSKFCINCQTKFADDKACKCGICRISKQRSFHCDVCGVCCHVELRDTHKCRAGSSHDECCICFEDAFTGCQILPCSHKVHKKCASQMIREIGIIRCPICHERGAHRPVHPPRKHHGKM